ncbi:MAG: polymer-forming cytoskeletal protein [Gilvibacter sp.]
MFSDKKGSSLIETRTSQNKISKGTKIVGDIQAEGGIRVEGSVDGTIATPGKVVIGQTGELTGNLICDNADIEGRVTGKLRINGTLTLRATAHIEGEVTVAKLAVEPGATFNASCAMNNEPIDYKKPIETNKAISLESQNPQNNPFDRAQRTKKPKAEQQN